MQLFKYLLLTLAPVASVAIGGFSKSCNTFALAGEALNFFDANCADSIGVYGPARINLDKYIEDDRDVLKWSTTGFYTRSDCADCHLVGTFLECECSGNLPKINLDERIANHNGKLVYTPPA